MKKVASYAEKVLNENYRNSVSRWDEQNPGVDFYTIEEWCRLESEEDPDFYRWLFNDGDIKDFGSNLTEDELLVAKNFFELLTK